MRHPENDGVVVKDAEGAQNMGKRSSDDFYNFPFRTSFAASFWNFYLDDVAVHGITGMAFRNKDVIFFAVDDDVGGSRTRKIYPAGEVVVVLDLAARLEFSLFH